MRVFRLFPWRWLIKRLARRQGFLDPFELLARLRRFSQPSEVQEPIELIRAGMVFHARGLVNTKVIQHNLDWIWPYWIVRQFSPDDPSFLPRAFSFSHVNLTHRNWTALGHPGCLELPIVDPRGMVTPHHDDWSVDHWFLAEDGSGLFPSRLREAEHQLVTDTGHGVETHCRNETARLRLVSQVVRDGDRFLLETRIHVEAFKPGRLLVSCRPCNPEGIQFIEEAAFTENGRHLQIGTGAHLEFSDEPQSTFVSDYHKGDVLEQVRAGRQARATRCAIGLASAAAAFEVDGGREGSYSYRIPLVETAVEIHGMERPEAVSWPHLLKDWSDLQVPDTRMREIHESAKRTLALLSQTEILPGPYTYRRFWFRDACLIGHALLGLNQDRLVRRALGRFPGRQRRDGYFHSQEGEWDSNGQVLWLADRYERATGRTDHGMPVSSLLKGARWIHRKRMETAGHEGPQQGLLPAGFSAEHLGPNDYYYWDDFWGVAGLEAAEALMRRREQVDAAAQCSQWAAGFRKTLLRNIEELDAGRVGEAIPAAPTRRMDSGAIGSLVADYPLQLDWVPESRIRSTTDWLLRYSLYRGGFFQDMIHSGVNAYLTLDLAQTCLRMRDPRYWDLLCTTADLASPTGKWPEAVHPRTGGGCMGDGEHAWAAAEWCQMMRSLFLLEENGWLRLGAGLPEEWLEQDSPLSYGPTLTRWGKATLHLSKEDGHWRLLLETDFHAGSPQFEICLPRKYGASLKVLP